MLYWTFSSAMPFLILDQGTGHGYHFISRKHKLVTSIFPGMNLHWSFRVLNRFEKFVNVPQASEKNDVRPCAASLWQLHIILWKNVYVKRLRRHYVTTILEVALVVALLLGIQEYAVARETMKVRLDTHFPTSAPTKYWNAMPDVVAIDKSQYLSKLVRESFSDLGVLDVSAVDSLKNLNDAINKLNDTPTVVIGLHFKNVRSNTTGIPSSLDCVVASYWVPRIEFVSTPEKTAQEKDNFEAEPNDQVVAIEIVQACKNYDTVRAVCSADLRILESQITVLLGHNGAGKSTLLNIVTGFIDSSSGTVLLGGYDIRKSTRDARESIGYCAQHNILFEDLTVEEHLLFFAIVRGIPRDRVRLEVVTLLGDVGLTSVSDQLAVSLTSGLQRRLCTALAVIGNPKIVVLDEPTANMDPDGRREMWELLLKVRRNSAILLTTQHLDEADVLGDRIAIMANGRIRCLGSPTFLKHRFTTGYHLQVNKTPKCNLLAIEFLLRKYAPRAHLQSDSDNEAIFVVGQIVATRHTITMFKELEQRKEDLGFESLGLAVTTLEDVLMRVGEEHHIHRHHTQPDADDNQEMIEARQSVIKVIVSTKRSKPSLAKKIFALLSKRAICTRRQWRMPLFSWILPPLLLFLLFFLENATLRGSGYARGGRDNELDYRFHKVLGSGHNPHAGLLVLVAYNTARLRNLTGNPRSRMTFSVRANPVALIEEDEAEQNQNTYREVMPKILRSILFPMVSSLMCSNFVIFPITERVVQASSEALHLACNDITLRHRSPQDEDENSCCIGKEI
ncbi:ABC transporter, putative [Ixodes scapularis]|uniref:ABC transporter, putative n=1 Tax=Ixodes scapularis TaxID=6945 RepID=B7PDQ4_IXOSC|nr:ABC transporter, putative [Ixodes scapularis]|eukprot:XP_002410998.1 ABC transporter, putative [Ixodes scapularis]